MIHLYKSRVLVDFVGFFSIAAVCLCYIIGGSNFAENHLQLSFLDFPIFVGEILLFLCVSLSFIKNKDRLFTKDKTYLLIVFYVFYVLINAVVGYLYWGPLALRHSALYYYPAFIFLSYDFYRKNFFSSVFFFLVLFSIIILYFLGRYDWYWTLHLFFIALTALVLVKPKWLKYLLFAVVLSVFPFRQIYTASRTLVVANSITGIFFAFALYFYLPLSRHYRILVFLLLTFLTIIGMNLFVEKGMLQSMNYKKVSAVYERVNSLIKIKKPSFQMEELRNVHVYNDNKEGYYVGMSNDEKRKTLESREATILKHKTEDTLIGRVISKQLTEEQLRALKELELSLKEKELEYDISTNNGVFRLLIWRDMFEELWHKKAFFGFGFGKPLRSISLEIMEWARFEWRRDGWVAAHNSYFHIIYRTGIIGIVLIVIILKLFVEMVKYFIISKKIIGIYLSCILLSWFIAANFLVIFELPYTAIPIWSIFGVTLAYYHQCKREAVESV